MSVNLAPRQQKILYRGLALLLVMVSFWLKLAYLQTSIYHTDEFISMLVIQMVARRGLPILPSGLFYDYGLLYSFLSGGLVALVGFAEPIARWPVILVSVFTIAAYFMAARSLFDARLAGLLAAGLVTFDVLTIKWGVWARGYAQAHLFVLLGLTWLLTGTLKKPNRRDRFLFLACLAGAIFSHTLTLFILPPLALLLLIFTLAYRRNWIGRARPWPELLVGGLILAVAVWVLKQGHLDTLPALQDPQAGAPPPFGLEFLRGFFLPGFEWVRFHRLVKFFDEPAYTLLLPLIGLGLISTLYRFWRQRSRFADVAFLFLVLFGLLVIAEMAILLTVDWQKSLYMFFLTLPAFFLLAAASLAWLLGWLVALLNRTNWQFLSRQTGQLLLPVAGLLLIAVIWGPAALDTVQAQTTGAYDTAMKFVAEQRQPGDKIMTEHPSAAYVYLGQTDYYANQTTAKVLADDETHSSLVDRYTASPLIDTAAKFSDVFSRGESIWLVVGDDHLNKYFDPLFHPQIFAHMDLVRRFGETYVFKNQAYSLPIPAEPTGSLEANFGDFIRLDGYSLNPAARLPDGTTLLGLYWRPIGQLPPVMPKVFVQLRNGQGQTIAQADHFIFDETLNSKRWQKLRDENEWLRDSTYLSLPNPLPASEGPYHIYVGLYDRDSFERVPLLNDTSGEFAALIPVPASSP